MKKRTRLRLAAGRAGTEALRRTMRRAAGLDRVELEVDGLRVPCYRRKGYGPTALLVHGFGGDKDNWALLAPRLARWRPLLIPDLPGFGEATPVAASAATLGDQAARLVQLLDQLKVRRAHVVGHSMGGGVAQRLAADAPERMASMTLLGSMGPKVGLAPLDHALDAGRNPLLPESLADTDAYLAFIAERLPPLPRAMKLFAVQQAVDARERLAAIFEVIYGREAWPGLPEDLSQLDVATLVLHGELDRVIPLSTAHALAQKLPRVSLHVLLRVGHCPQLEAPGRVATMLEQFWEWA